MRTQHAKRSPAMSTQTADSFPNNVDMTRRAMPTNKKASSPDSGTVHQTKSSAREEQRLVKPRVSAARAVFESWNPSSF